MFNTLLSWLDNPTMMENRIKKIALISSITATAVALQWL
jgi:hypothetical protein